MKRIKHRTATNQKDLDDNNSEISHESANNHFES